MVVGVPMESVLQFHQGKHIILREHAVTPKADWKLRIACVGLILGLVGEPILNLHNGSYNTKKILFQNLKNISFVFKNLIKNNSAKTVDLC